jgi:Glycosyl hydrolases family 25
MTIHFYDVSHYNAGFKPSGPTMAKATEGTAMVDASYAANEAATLAGGWPFCAYHFLDAGVDVKAQAAHAFSVIGTTPAMLDVERGTGGNPTLGEVTSFVDAYRALGGIMHLIYLPHWYWQDTWGSPSLQPLINRGLSLISSNYTTYSDTGPGWAPYGGMTPAIWQYTSTPLDTNAFKGTVDELAALFNGTPNSGEDMALTQDDANLVADAVWAKWLGKSGPTAMMALQDTHTTVLALPTADEIADAVVAKLPQDGGTVDPAAIATAVADELARRLQS